MADDDEDEPSHLRIVSDNPNARVDRQVEWAKEDLERALAQFAAALLRTMAGSEREATYLLRHLSILVDTLNKFREQSGRGMSVAELQEALRLPQAEFGVSSDDWSHRGWLRQHGFETIIKGALRLAAHKVLGEEPHFGGKYSKDVIRDGIKTLDELKKPPPPPRPSPLESGETKRVFGERLESTVPAATPRGRRKDQGFSQEDLKELRKAIKTNDNKRIAELTAKIGKPTFEK